MYIHYYLHPSAKDLNNLEKFKHFIKQLSEATDRGQFMVGIALLDSYIYPFFAVEEQFCNQAEIVLRSIYPNSTHEQHTFAFDNDKIFELPVKFKHNDLIPIKVLDTLTDPDPINELIESLKIHSKVSGYASFEIWLKPFSKSISDKASLLSKSFTASADSAEIKKQIERKKTSKLFHSMIRCTSLIEDDQFKRAIEIYLNQYGVKDGNSLTVGAFKESTATEAPTLDSLLSIDEVASVIHIPEEILSLRKLVTVNSAQLPVPKEVRDMAQNPEATLFGDGMIHGSADSIAIHPSDRNHHMYIIGKTGSGKTKLLQLLMKSDIENGNGVIFLDPHGDTAIEMLKLIPENRIDDCVFIDFPKKEFVHIFNPLDYLKEQREVVTENFVEIFRRFFSVDWNPRMEFLLRNIFGLMKEADLRTIAEIPPILVNAKFRQAQVEKIKDPTIKNFWLLEYPKFSEVYFSQAISPLLSKINQLLSHDLIGRVLSFDRSSFDIKKIISEKKILIVNLSIGELGEFGCSFIGSMIISSILQTAMGNAAIPFEKRPQIDLYVDEFQNFSTESFIRIFSEARKYKLALTVAHQYIGQIPQTIMQSILGNVGSVLAFRLGQADANFISEEFKPYLTPEDFVQLSGRQFWSKLSINGMTSKPFLGRSLDLVTPEINYSRDIRHASVAKYGMLRAEIDKAIELQKDPYSNDQINSFPAPLI